MAVRKRDPLCLVGAAFFARTGEVVRHRPLRVVITSEDDIAGRLGGPVYEVVYEVERH